MLTIRNVNKFVHKIHIFVRVENVGDLFISAHETWDQHITCCVYIFVQYSRVRLVVLTKISLTYNVN